MKVDEFIDRIANYIQVCVKNPQEPATRAFLRVIGTSSAKAIMKRKIGPYIGLIADVDGEIDLSEAKEIASAAFGDEQFRLLDMVILSSADVESFFSSCS